MRLVSRTLAIVALIPLFTLATQKLHAQNRNLCMSNCALNNSDPSSVALCQSYCPTTSAPSAKTVAPIAAQPRRTSPPRINGAIGGLSKNEGEDYSGKTKTGIGETGCQMLTDNGVNGRHPKNTQLCYKGKVKLCKIDPSAPANHQYYWETGGMCPLSGIEDADHAEMNMKLMQDAAEQSRPD